MKTLVPRSRMGSLADERPQPSLFMKVLMIDIGGSNVKVMVSGNEEMRKFPSGRTLTARQMVTGVKRLTKDWEYDAIALGFPGLVENGKLVREPLNLSGGCLRFNFAKAFGHPVRIINDAALQALANYITRAAGCSSWGLAPAWAPP